MAGSIEHKSQQHRFVTIVDGVNAHLEYERTGEVMAITHTDVPAAIGGRGIAGALVEAAMEYARSEGLKVDPQCSYSEVWMRRHPQYEDLRA